MLQAKKYKKSVKHILHFMSQMALESGVGMHGRTAIWLSIRFTKSIPPWQKRKSNNEPLNYILSIGFQKWNLTVHTTTGPAQLLLQWVMLITVTVHLRVFFLFNPYKRKPKPKILWILMVEFFTGHVTVKGNRLHLYIPTCNIPTKPDLFV
jgi:hypothetical protein